MTTSTPHPWRELSRMSHLELLFARLPSGVWGLTRGNVIVLDDRLLQVERRCTLAHELEHRRRGHDSCQPPAEEARVCAAAARWLLPDPHDVADALVWARLDLTAAAEHLWVDEPTMRARLDPRHLHPAERAIITKRITEEIHP